jgi:hypothetical protein
VIVLWGSSIALLPFWCLDAKGGEVVLLGFALGREFALFALCFVNYLCYLCGTLVLLCNRLVILNFVLLV